MAAIRPLAPVVRAGSVLMALRSKAARGVAAEARRLPPVRQAAQGELADAEAAEAAEVGSG